MRRFLLASHGHFADGIKHSLNMIIGDQQNVSTLCAYVNKSFDIKEEVKEIIASLPANDELIVLTDIFGGSVNNEFMKYLSDSRIHLVSGLNLPLLIELVTSNNRQKDTNTWLKNALYSSKSGIQYCNELVLQAGYLEEENF